LKGIPLARFGAEERFELVGAVVGGLWVGSLFLPWFGTGDSVTGWSIIDSSWLALVVVALGALLLLLDGVSQEGFRALPVPAIATFLMGMGVFYTALVLIPGQEIRYGAWTAFGLSAGAFLLSAAAWTLDRRG